jgi:hypothetical protein
MEMVKTTIVALMVVVAAATGCKKAEETEALRIAVNKIGIPRGSVVSYASVPDGTQLLPGRHMGGTNATVLRAEGYVVFVDEKPGYDWVHPFRLMFIPKAGEKAETLFQGSAFPDFTFKRPDGSSVTNWSKY